MDVEVLGVSSLEVILGFEWSNLKFWSWILKCGWVGSVGLNWWRVEIWIQNLNLDSNGIVDLICEFRILGVQVLKFEVIFGFEWSNFEVLKFWSWFYKRVWVELEHSRSVTWMVSWNLKFGMWILDYIGIVDWICEFQIFIWSIWILNGGFELCLRVRSLKSEVIFGFEWSNLKFGSCLMGLSWYLTFEGVLVSWWFEFGIEILDLIGEFRISFEKKFVFWRDIWNLNGGFWIWSLMREVCSL